MQEKAAVGSFRRSRNTIAAAAKKAKTSRAKPRKRVDPVSYDGDNDGKITNPLTGADEIPWNREAESPQEAIAKFFANRRTGAQPKKPEPKQTATQVPGAPKQMPAWPRTEGGELAKIKDLDDATLSNMIDFWSNNDSTKNNDAVKKLLGNMRRENTKRQAAAEKRRRDAKNQQEAFTPTYPDKWSGQGKEGQSLYAEGSTALDRFRSSYISADIVDGTDIGEDGGYAVVGEYRSDWDDGFYFDDGATFNSVEDAMSYLEQLETQLRDGDDPLDSEFAFPSTGAVTAGESVIDENPQPGIEGSAILNDAYDLFTQQWLDKRRNENIEDNIREADWRMDELRQMMESLQVMYAEFYPDFESAYYMSAGEYANWALRSGYVDSLSEGRQVHKEIMNAYDEMGEEQEIITDMIDTIRSDKEYFINQWNARHDGGNSLFPSSYQQR